MSQRTERLDSQIRGELMELVQREMSDPRIGFATITSVETSPDLRHARVWVSVLGTDEEREDSLEALRAATPWFRRRLGQRLRLRRVPELAIHLDRSIESGDRVLRLLHGLGSESKGDPESADAQERGR
jgi:ribosome-binding factor A